MGLPANRNTVRLHNEFSYTACPHRSAKLHTGIDPTKQAWTKSTQLKLKDYFIKQIRAYMKGDTPKVATVKNKPGSASTPANRRDMNGWKINKYGTYYKSKKVHLLLILQLSQDVLVHLLRVHNQEFYKLVRV